MYVELRNVEVRDDGFIYILNKQGFVAQLPVECQEGLDKYAGLESLPEDAPDYIRQLADAGLLSFDNYEPDTETYYYDDALLNASGEDPVYAGPVIAHLAITTRCNMGCSYCSVKDLHDSLPEPLTTEQYKHVIDVLVDSGAFQVGLTGGEPTLHPDLPELVAHVVSKGAACNITTNGWELPDELADALVEAGLTQAQISLDAHVPEVHEKYRSPGSFERALATARKLMERGIIVGCDCVVSKGNFGLLEDFIGFLEENGFAGLTLIKLKQGHLSVDEFKDASVGYGDYAKFIDWLCRRDSPMEITIDCSSVPSLCATLSEEEETALHSAGCPVGHTLISIAPNGDIYPCAALTGGAHRLGNVFEDDFDELWCHHPLLKRMRGIKETVGGKCAECSKLNVCRAGCRGIAESLTGDLMSGDPSCGL